LPQKKAAGNQVTETAPGGLVTNAVYNVADQVTSVAEDPSGGRCRLPADPPIFDSASSSDGEWFQSASSP
jgi:hypothetical protein